MTSEMLDSDQIRTLRDGTISTLMEWAPKLIPGIEKAISRHGDLVKIDPQILGKSGEVRLLTSEDAVILRKILEKRSLETLGVKIRIDRNIVGEAINLFASENCTGSSWMDALPPWDGTTRIREIAGRMGICPFFNCGEHGNAQIIEAVGRLLFMRPVLQSLGMTDPFAPLPVFIDADPSEVRGILSPLAMDRPIMETTTTVVCEQIFTESFDPTIPYLILPDAIPALCGGPESMDVRRFKGVLSKSSAFYRIPNMGKSRGEPTLIPLMVGTVALERWPDIAEAVPVIPLVLKGPEQIPETDVLQCFAEARAYIEQDHPIKKPERNKELPIKTDYSSRNKDAKKKRGKA